MDSKLLILLPISFFVQFLDAALGMGHGTIMAPILLLMGFSPLEVVPGILFSELITDSVSSYFHHRFKNVDLSRGSADLRLAMVLAVFAMVGTFIAVNIAVHIPLRTAKMIIALMVIGMGILIAFPIVRKPRFTWRKIIVLGTLASFNKAISGGGYGPLLMGGQILSGIGIKNAVGIAALSKAITCLAGITFYFIYNINCRWMLGPWLALGGIFAIPLAAYTLRESKEHKAREIAAFFIILLGCFTLYKLVTGK